MTAIPCPQPAAPNAGANAAAGWSAALAVRIGCRGARTFLAHNAHHGPLRVQKLLQPGGDAPAELLLVHPPGGIAGADQLRLTLDLEAGARCLVTTPGATRWYRSSAGTAVQQTTISVADGAALEWLPQDNIVQQQADAAQQVDVALQGSAVALGCEVLQFGQPQAGRPWLAGRWQQRFAVRRDGRLLLAEHWSLDAAELAHGGPSGLAGRTVLGVLWASLPPSLTLSEDLLAQCRALAGSDPAVLAGLSWLEPPVGCLVMRGLAHDAWNLRQRLLAVWALLRPVLLGCAARPPRIWAT